MMPIKVRIVITINMAGPGLTHINVISGRIMHSAIHRMEYRNGKFGRSAPWRGVCKLAEVAIGNTASTDVFYRRK